MVWPMGKKKEKAEKKNTRRDRIMTLLTDGRLTQSEAAELLGVSRQRIHQWIVKAKVHPALARTRYLKKLLYGRDHSAAMQL